MNQTDSGPPPGLAGLDPRWSRMLQVTDSSGLSRTWHVLDNLATLDGETPVGTIVCVHGNPTWSYLWRAVVAAGAAAGPPWRVVAVDQLNMGFSQRTGTTRGLAQRIDDLSRLTDALELAGPLVSFGHDWGGAISLGWALRHRDRLAAVMLLNTAVHQPAGSPLPGLIALAGLPGVRWGVTTATATFLRTTLAIAHPRLSADVAAGYLAPYRTAARRTAIGDFVADIPLSPRHRSWPALEELVEALPALADVPALLLWGPRDPVFSDRYLRDLRGRLPQATVHRFETAGHLIAEDVDVAGTALTWLGDQLTAAPTPQPTTDDVAGRRPLWAQLRARADDRSAAVVEPGAGGRGAPRSTSWQLLARRVDQLAAGLGESGVRAGDRVALLVPPGSELTVALYACLRIGAVVVIADAGLGLKGLHRAVRGAEVRHVIAVDRGLLVARALSWSGARIAIGDPGRVRRRVLGAPRSLEGLGRLGTGRAVPAPPGPDQDAVVLFTSGSTGPAKGVVYTHRRLEAVRDTLLAAYPIGPGDRFVAAFAPFALFGPALGVTSSVPQMDVTAPRTLTAAALADAAAAVDATVVFASPAALDNVVRTCGGLSPGRIQALHRIRMLLSAGSPVPPAMLGRLQELMPDTRIHTPYGMTEALLLTDVELPEILAAGPGNGVLVGRPMAGVEIAISPLDDAGRVGVDLTDKANLTGEILARAAHLKDRYDQLWVTERAASQPVGWHRTGDVGHLDDDGRLWVEGRLAHVQRTAEGFVTPVGVEQRIETVPAVARAALVGVGPPDRRRLVAVLETTPPSATGPAGPTLAAAVRAVAGVELVAVLVVDRLKTDIRHNAKIDRVAVGRRAGETLAGGARGRRG